MPNNDGTVKIGVELDEQEFKSRLSKLGSSAKSALSNFSKAYSNTGDLLKPTVDGFKAVENAGKKAGNVVMDGLKGFTVAATAVAGFGAAAAKAGMEFDATMSEVSAISGATGDALLALRNKAIEMGGATKFSATEAAEAMTYMGMAGWKTEDMLSGIAGIMNLAAASGEDLATTSDIVTDALTAFNLTAADSNHFADVLAQAATNANTDVGMMGETFKYVAPIAGSLSYSIEDTALAIGLMANSSIKGSMAGTTLRSILTRLSTDAGASSKKLGALGVLTEKLGVEFYNTDGSARALNDVLMDSRAAWAGLSEEQQISYAKTIAGQEAMSGWIAMMNASDEDVQKLTASLRDATGAAEEMARIRLDNLAGDITYLKSAFGSLQIAISDSLKPILREFAQFGIKAMRNLLEGFQGGGVSGFMNALTGIVTQGVTMLAQKAPEFSSVSLQFIEALANGILGARMEIGMAAINIFDMLIDGISSWLSTNSGELIAAGNQIIAILFSAFLKAGNVIEENIGQFIPLIARAFIDYHDALFSVGMDILGAIAQGIVENKDGIQAMASQAIDEMVYSFQQNAPMIIKGGLALLEALAGAIVDNLPLIVETGAQIIGQLVLGISTASPAVQAIIATTVIPHILKIVDTVGSIGTAVSSVVKLVSGEINTIMGIGSKLMGGIQALFALVMAHPVIAVITAIIAAITLLYTHCEAFRDGVKAVIDKIVEFFKTGKLQITISLDDIKNAINHVIEHIRNAFKGKLGEAAQWGKDLIKNLVDGIKAGWNSLKQSVSNIAGQLTGILSGGSAKTSSLSSSGGAARTRSIAAASPVPVNASIGNAEGEGVSLTASTLSRAAAIQAFESAMPAIVGRVSAATAQMAPVSGYSVSSAPASSGLISAAKGLEEALQDLISKTGDRDIVINLTAEMDGDVVTRKVVRRVNDMTISSGKNVLLF